MASSPGLFDSGYFVLAAVAGSPADTSQPGRLGGEPRRAAATAGMIMVIPKRVGHRPVTRSASARISCAMSDGFAKSTDTEAAVGGIGGAFGDFTTERAATDLAGRHRARPSRSCSC